MGDVRVVMKTNVEEKRGKEGPKKWCLDGIESDTRIVGVRERVAGDRVFWRYGTGVADPI